VDGDPEIPEEPMGSTLACRRCGGTMKPIWYGYPDRELFEAADRGDVAIGGCVIPMGDIPQWRCFDCGRDVYVAETEAEA
jgi:hypothetical protein